MYSSFEISTRSHNVHRDLSIGPPIRAIVFVGAAIFIQYPDVGGKYNLRSVHFAVKSKVSYPDPLLQALANQGQLKDTS